MAWKKKIIFAKITAFTHVYPTIQNTYTHTGEEGLDVGLLSVQWFF